MGEREYTEEELSLEIKSLRRIVSAYFNYPYAAEKDVRRYERSFRKLPPTHKAILSHLRLKFQRLRMCISANASFIMTMLEAFEPPFDMSQDVDTLEDNPLCSHEHCHSKFCCSEGSNYSMVPVVTTSGSNFLSGNGVLLDSHNSAFTEDMNLGGSSLESSVDLSNTSNGASTLKNPSLAVSLDDEHMQHCCSDPLVNMDVSLADVEKVRCIIRNIVRDWAKEGKKERDECYTPILDDLNRHFPHRSEKTAPSCLVPGAGLGRLALEISSLGFVSQGNEFSYFMMICSNLILNHAQQACEWTIYPWIHSNCNSLSDDDQLRPVSFPDIHPASAGITDGFSMCAGDFVEVYNSKDQEARWDAVVTCFFLDTAHNVVEYIEIISRILKDGGVWVNLGPLLYHFADAYAPEDEMSIELSLEDVKNVASHYGFEMDMERMIETTYTANPRSMMQNRYTVAFWTMKRRPRLC